MHLCCVWIFRTTTLFQHNTALIKKKKKLTIFLSSNEKTFVTGTIILTSQYLRNAITLAQTGTNMLSLNIVFETYQN